MFQGNSIGCEVEDFHSLAYITRHDGYVNIVDIVERCVGELFIMEEIVLNNVVENEPIGDNRGIFEINNVFVFV